MKPRTIVIGCSAIALLALLFVGVSGFFLFRHLTAPAPLPAPSALVTSDSVGLALLRLEPDTIWVRSAFEHLARRSQAPAPAAKITPLEVVWTARHSGPAGEGHLVAMTLSPNGRFLGLSVDLALWKAGRAGGPLTRRVEHGGEGITSFPGAHIPGQFFVRGPTIAWGSDLEAAQRGVDLLTAGERGDPAPSGLPVLALYPGEGHHTLRGALMEQDGSLSRLLAAVPGAAGPPPDLTGLAGLSFVLDPTSATEGSGEIRLRYADSVPPELRGEIAARLSAWLRTVSPAGMQLAATPREEAPGEALALTASGLEGVVDTMVRAVARAERAVKRMQDGGEEPPKDQSSSTFQ
jgi:hypothetical protein